MGFKALCAGVAAAAGGAALAQGSARWAVAGALLLALAAVLLARRAQPRLTPEPPPPPAPPDRLQQLQTQLAHVPAAAWLLSDDGLQALSHRAHRLLAPGAVQDAAALQAALVARGRRGQAGLLELDTERGCERWSLALQPLQWAGQAQVLMLLLPMESALEGERLSAWQQLTQVLTHEIMNSLTPIASLAQSAQALQREPGAEVDLDRALDTIARRAQGLQRFVADYRRISQLPAPQPAPVDLAALLQRLEAALAPAWAARGGRAYFLLAHPGLRLQADAAQLEQGLLNLIRNAEQATAATPAPQLWVEIRLSRGGRLRIGVRDNGPGVPAGLEQQIFLPFFSATPGGSGIGLALTRQLVHGMGGRLRHTRPLAGGAEFVISF